MQLKLEQDVLQSVGEKGKAVEAKQSVLFLPPRGRNKTCVGQSLINKPRGLLDKEGPSSRPDQVRLQKGPPSP